MSENQTVLNVIDGVGTSPSMLIGYQYSQAKTFIGTYEFPNNQDKEEIHLPPNTTLVPAPTTIPSGKEAYWTGTEWLLRPLTPLPANPYNIEKLTNPTIAALVVNLATANLAAK